MEKKNMKKEEDLSHFYFIVLDPSSTSLTDALILVSRQSLAWPMTRKSDLDPVGRKAAMIVMYLVCVSCCSIFLVSNMVLRFFLVCNMVRWGCYTRNSMKQQQLTIVVPIAAVVLMLFVLVKALPWGPQIPKDKENATEIVNSGKSL